MSTDTSSAVQRNTEQIILRLTDYLSIRFDHATRINLNLRTIKQDLIYHEMAKVRRCLNGLKVYGTTKMAVAEVFVADDDTKRRQLMSPTDQTSIQVELVSHCQDERVESTRGQIKIHDIKAYYASIDPGLANFLDLVETWIWWDILDAAEQVRFEQKLGRVQAIRKGQFSDELRHYYARLILSGADGEVAADISPQDALAYEIKQLQHIRERWAHRRDDDEGHQFILKRDEQAHAEQTELITLIGHQAREYEEVRALDKLDEEAQHRFAHILNLPPERVTREAVLDSLRTEMVTLEQQMFKQTDPDENLGAPYRYKMQQLQQMDKWLVGLTQPASAAGGGAAAS